MNLKGKKRIIIIASAAVLVLGGGGGYYAYAKRASATAVSNYLTGTVKVGDVTKVATATGTVQNKSSVNLSFGSAGRLTKLNVKVGDIVKKGQVLAEIDKSQLQNQLDSARSNLKSAQAKLDLLRQGPTNADLASLQAQVTRAQSDLENAKSNLETAKQNVDKSYLSEQVRIAANQLTVAQKNYDAINKTGDPVQISMAKSQLDQATKNYNTAIAAQSNLTQSQTELQNTQNAVRSAQAAYDSAVVQLNSKNAPPTTADLAQAEAAVEQAQASLVAAENNLAQATLTAPFDGVVTATNSHEGEQVSGNTTVVSVQSTESGIQLVLPIDEADISLIKNGQTATVTADSLPGKKFEAIVDQVSPTGTTQNNVTTFPVTLILKGDTSDLKVGQSMTANILIDKRTGVLTVPSEALRGVGNKKSVMVYTSSSANPTPTEVVTGLDDGSLVEIRSGLSEGQKIVLGARSSSTNGNSRNSNSSGNRQGGGFGGIPGGLGGGNSRPGR